MASISFCFTLASRLILGHLFSVFISHVMFDLSPVIHSKGSCFFLLWVHVLVQETAVAAAAKLLQSCPTATP